MPNNGAAPPNNETQLRYAGVSYDVSMEPYIAMFCIVQLLRSEQCEYLVESILLCGIAFVALALRVQIGNHLKLCLAMRHA